MRGRNRADKGSSEEIRGEESKKKRKKGVKQGIVKIREEQVWKQGGTSKWSKRNHE